MTYVGIWYDFYAEPKCVLEINPLFLPEYPSGVNIQFQYDVQDDPRHKPYCSTLRVQIPYDWYEFARIEQTVIPYPTAVLLVLRED